MSETDTEMVETRPKRTRRKRQSLVRTDTAPRPTPHRRFALTTLRSVRREMAYTYWRAHDGELSMADASRLAFILASLGKVIEASDLEFRIRRLELQEHG